MILLADSGSTKTDWVLVNKSDGGIVASIHTPGINPVHQHPDVIRQSIPMDLTADEVYFYGAGCTPTHTPMMKALLAERFPKATIEVQSDLMAAARALCGREEGIACILGTGANSCLYDGKRIVQNTPALGYILGDEGSGAVLGRMFMNAIFKNPALSAVRDDFLQQQQQSLTDIIRHVYREPMPNRFLASTSLYIAKHSDHPLLHDIVVSNFRHFFSRNVAPYQRTDLPVQFVGSMAYYYPQQLSEAALAEGFVLGRVLKSPMEGLMAYHQVF